MGNIKATFSAIENYKSKCRYDYNSILNKTQDILDRAEKMYGAVQQDYDNIGRQVVRAHEMHEVAKSRVEKYEFQMDRAFAEMNACSEQINYLYNNPTTVTSTDSEGNESTSVVYDEEAIRAADRKRDAAMQSYNNFSERYDEACEVWVEAGNTLHNYQNTRDAIATVGEAIKNCIFEIKKYINAIADEAEFNINSLQGVIDSLAAYLASKAIYLPQGAHYENFVSPET